MTDKPTNKPTLRKVAERAGVSLGTASHVFSNKPGVLPETRAKVIDAAMVLGYQPSARNMVQGRGAISTIGLLVKSTTDDRPVLNAFYSHVLAGAERECKRQALNLMYASIDVDERNRASGLPAMITEQLVDGVLVLGAFLEDTITQIGRQWVQPLVLVDAYAPGQAFDSVITNNIRGAQLAVDYLIGQGHRHIGLIGSTPDAYPSIRERRKGYTRALRENNIPDTYIEDGSLTRESAYEATKRLIRRCPQITALFCCNDQVAVAAMNAIRDLDLHVPDDVSVIGFDDIDLAQEVSPSLTTVHVDKVLMGALAVRHLLDRADHPERAALMTSLSTTLIVRDSVCPPRLELSP